MSQNINFKEVKRGFLKAAKDLGFDEYFAQGILDEAWEKTAFDWEQIAQDPKILGALLGALGGGAGSMASGGGMGKSLLMMLLMGAAGYGGGSLFKNQAAGQAASQDTIKNTQLGQQTPPEPTNFSTDLKPPVDPSAPLNQSANSFDGPEVPTEFFDKINQFMKTPSTSYFDATKQRYDAGATIPELAGVGALETAAVPAKATWNAAKGMADIGVGAGKQLGQGLSSGLNNVKQTGSDFYTGIRDILSRPANQQF